MNTTVIIGGENSALDVVAEVEYFGPLNITIPPLSVAVYGNTAVYINGTLYSCGGYSANGACYKYDLAANSGSWVRFTTIPGDSQHSPAVAFDDFFWYFNNQIQQVPVNGSSVTSYDWGLGYQGCAVGNGSHTVVIQSANRSVLMNSDASTPINWTTVTEINDVLLARGCLWLGNTIYVTGGFDIGANAIDTTELINSDTFEVTLAAPLPVGVWNHKMGVIDGLPAVFGGYTTGYLVLSSIYIYDYDTNTWSLSDRSVPGGRTLFGSATF